MREARACFMEARGSLISVRRKLILECGSRSGWATRGFRAASQTRAYTIHSPPLGLPARAAQTGLHNTTLEPGSLAVQWIFLGPFLAMTSCIIPAAAAHHEPAYRRNMHRGAPRVAPGGRRAGSCPVLLFPFVCLSSPAPKTTLQ